MTESDFEYLLRTLSEARSRATELTVAVRARAGADHRLAGLSYSAVSNIEKLLRKVRVLALDQAKSKGSAPLADQTSSRASVRSEHWLQSFIGELIICAGASDDVSFETVERILHQHKQAFQRDLETARRMYRVYPHLFSADNLRRADSN